MESLIGLLSSSDSQIMRISRLLSDLRELLLVKTKQPISLSARTFHFSQLSIHYPQLTTVNNCYEERYTKRG